MLWLLALLALLPSFSYAADSADQKPARVITTIAPLYMLTAGVMEDVGKPQLLMKAGTTPHHYTMKPSDAQRILNAAMLICTSREYEYYLEPLLNMLPERKHTLIEALATPGMTLVSAAAAAHESPTDLDETFVDMHFWLNPVNAIAFTRYIAEELTRIDPEHAAQYEHNATKQTERLRKLDAEIRDMLGDESRMARYASYHPSLGYFEEHYGITSGKAVTRTPETGASAAEAKALYEAVEAGEIGCLFQETEFSPRLLQQAADRYADQITLVTVDPLGATYPAEAESYDAMLRDVARQVEQCSERAAP